MVVDVAVNKSKSGNETKTENNQVTVEITRKEEPKEKKNEIRMYRKEMNQGTKFEFVDDKKENEVNESNYHYDKNVDNQIGRKIIQRNRSIRMYNKILMNNLRWSRLNEEAEGIMEFVGNKNRSIEESRIKIRTIIM